jgi:hypothetical protein
MSSFCAYVAGEHMHARASSEQAHKAADRLIPSIQDQTTAQQIRGARRGHSSQARTRDPRRKGFRRAATTGSSTLPSSASRCGRCATGEPPDDMEAAAGDGGPASAAADAAESADGLQMATRFALESLSSWTEVEKGRLHGSSCQPDAHTALWAKAAVEL